MNVKDYLKAYAIEQNWPADNDEDLMEILLDANYIETIQGAKHRWYIAAKTVVQIKDKYIQFDDYITTGDNNANDLGLEYNLDSAKFVEKKERQITEIYFE